MIDRKDDTSGKILDRYVKQNVGHPHNDDPIVEDEGTEDLRSFGWLRGIRDRAMMLELRKRDGNIVAIGYGYLERAEFNPTDGITLFAAARKVQIKGRNLNLEVRPSIRLFEGITRHRVSWIQEAERQGGASDSRDSTTIESISW